MSTLKDRKYLTYMNSFELLKYRGYSLSNDGSSLSDSIKEMPAFIHDIDKNHYIKTTAYNDKKIELSVIIFDVDSKYLKASGRTKFFESTIITGNTVFVTNRDKFHNNILALCASHYSSGDKKYRMEVAVYDQLIFNFPTHKTFNKSRILSKEEIDLFCGTVMRPVSNLALIRSQDASCFWIGAMPGDIVAIERPSDYAGFAEELRRVVRVKVKSTRVIK